MSNNEKAIKLALKEDYPLIPMSEITDEARLIAVAWVEGYERQGMDIPGKQKLASDIMNYTRRHSSARIDVLEEEITRLKNELLTYQSVQAD